MSEFLKKLSELINAKNPAYQNNRQQITSEAINTSNKTGTSNAPESVAKPATTPISANTQTNTTNNQAPKTTPISTPISAPKTTPVTTSAKNTSVPPTAKSGQAPVDPKSGAAGAKVFNEIMDSDPGVFVKKDKILTEVYNAGFYGMDITREIRDNARAGNYLEQIEAIYNAGKQDSKGKPTDDKTKKADDGLSTEAARKEKILWMQNTKQAQKSAESKSVPDDLSTEAAREEHISQKKLDNQGKAVYTSGNNTGDGDSNGISVTAGSELIDPNTIGKEGLKISDVSFYDEKAKKNVECVVYANNRAREYWGIKGHFEIDSAVDAVRKGEAAPFLEIYSGGNMEDLISIPSHSLAFFGPTIRNKKGHEVFIEGKDDKYIYFSESNFGDAPTNGKVQRMTYEEFFKRGGGFIGYAAINMKKYKELYGN